MKGPFFYRHNEQQIGPLSAQELKQHAAEGKLLPDDLVSAAGLEGWQPARRLKNVFPTPSTPPPLPGGIVDAPPVAPPVVESQPEVANPARKAAAAAPFKQQAVEKLAKGSKLALTEAGATSKACAAQAKRSLTYGRLLVDARNVGQRAHAAQQRLGEQLYAAGLGDESLRRQLDQLAERRKSVEAAKGAVKLLEAERRGLCIRLAEPFLSQASPGEQVGEAHRAAVALKEQLVDLERQTAERRSELVPADSKDRLRVVLGCAAAAIVLLLIVWMFKGGGSAMANMPGVPSTPNAPSDDSGGSPPVATPPQESLPPKPPPQEPPPKKSPSKEPDRTKPVVQESQEPANDFFPRRRVVATVVGDQPHGELKCYDDRNRLIAVEHYRNGTLHGKRTTYYPSGKKFGEIEFVNGKPNGASVTYYENGNKAASIDFVNGAMTGRSVTYFSNGGTCVEGQLVNGTAAGSRSHYIPDGEVFAVTQWQNGQQVGQKVNFEPTAAELAAIEERANFSTMLNDHWP